MIDGEVIDIKIKSGEQLTSDDIIETLKINKYRPEMKVTRSKIENHKDEIEKKTGVFNWLFQDGRYVPIHRLTDKELQDISIHCERKMSQLHDYIEVKFDQMCAWQYRLEKIQQQAEERQIELKEYEG